MSARTTHRSGSAFFLSVLFFGALLSGGVTQVFAQTATLTSFGASASDTDMGLILASDGNFYGVTSAPAGGVTFWSCPDNPNNNCNFIDKITPGGTATPLYTFEQAPGDTTTPFGPSPVVEGSDGAFYGTTLQGGTSGYGTIFRITNYGVFNVLYNFPGDAINGPTYGSPSGPLTQAFDGNFYGVATGGPGGIVFYRVTPGGGFTVVFPGSQTIQGQAFFVPNPVLQGSDSNFYTITTAGIVQFTSSGAVTVIYPYPQGYSQQLPFPTGPLVEGSDGNFYATAQFTTRNPDGSNAGNGAVFKVSTSGSLQTLYTFSGGTDGYDTNPDLTLGGDGNLYGTTYYGGNPNCPSNMGTLGIPGCGTIFEIGISGGFHSLYSFNGTAIDGGRPFGQLVQGGSGDFYGTTFANYGNGIFDLAVTPPVPAPIQLTLNPTTVSPGNPTVLTWEVLNAFSLTMQQCHATIQGYPSGAGQWTGSQAGAFAHNSNVYAGTATITPTVLGTYVYALTCGGRESGFATLVVNDQLNVPAVLPGGLVGAAYANPANEFNGVPPYTTTITSGTPPPGLTVNPATGVIQGTPTQFGTFTFGLQVTDSNSPKETATGTTTLTIQSSLAITTAALSKGAVGAKYSQTLAATGGVPPYAWSVTGGTLPVGIQLAPSTGILSGTPTQEQAASITLQVVDSEGTPATTSVSLPFVINPPNPIAAVEFTQSIQQYQALADLNTSLSASNEPPVPIIANKPAVMRIYFTPDQNNVETYTVQVTGAINGTKTSSVLPECQPVDQRADAVPCTSLDFYFIPPAGSWTAALTVTDPSGKVLDTENFTITSRTTRSLNLKAVALCTSPSGGGVGCGDPALLLGMTYLVGTMMPVPNPVTVRVTTQKVSLSTTNYSSNWNAWEASLAFKVDKLYNAADATADNAGNMRTNYVGVYWSSITDPNGGAASIHSGHGTAIPDMNVRLGETNAIYSTLAHETGHTLGMVHTLLRNPFVGVKGTAPGCWGAGAPSPNSPASVAWPYATNNIQSSTGLEYGFNVVLETVIDPTNTFDIMSYCVPRWISPFNYKIAIEALNGGTVASPSVTRSPGALLAEPAVAPLAAPSLAQGSYWQVSGSILGTSATLDPIFTQTIQGTTDPGSGTYSIQEQDASGTALYTRYFTPSIAETETEDGDYFSNPEFSEWIPVTAGTSSIVVLDPDNNVLISQALTGSAPIVTITSPAAGFVGSGQQTVSWTIQSSAPSLSSRIFYSTDSGNTWQQIDNLTGTSDNVDFSTLPGAAAALLRVDVSDGVNTGSATSIPFSVPKKLPSTVVINAPLNGAIQPAANPVYLSGAAYDADDGVLTGTALQWTDNVQGALGSGSFLPVNLQPGTHSLTLTATDSDGNAITATTTITLGGGRPIVTLTTNTPSANCVSATIAATPGNQGASLSAVQYSLDGGNTYTPIPLAQLPFTFQVPGSGAVTLVAAALDVSGQVAAQSAVLNLGTGCAVAALITPTVAVSPTPSSITTTQSLSVTVAVSGGSGNPTPAGSVTLSSSGYTSSAATLSGGSATINIPAGSLATGTDSLTATYMPDSNSSSTYNGATGSNTVTVTTPAKTTPTVTVTPSPTSITTAQSLAVTIGVSGSPTPTGTVNLSSGTYTSTATALVSGGAMITVPAGSLAASTDTLTATYTPDSASSSTYNGATGSNSVTVTAATVQVTVGTSPAGLAFTVDGTNYTSAQTLSWTVGSSHTLTTTSPQTNGGIQNTFASWSDGGAISHSVTASSIVTSYAATFITSYQLTTAASPSADGSATPTSGSYYAAGTVVNLTATPNSGYNFTNWTGSVASTGSASTTVTMNAPESVTANFSAVVVTAPVASLTPPSLSFTSTTSVASAAQAATLSNTGNAALTITGISIAGTNPTDFAITTGANACSSSLAASSSCSIYVTFTPASATNFAATLSVADNAVGSPQTTTLAGTGTAAPSFTVSSTTTPQTVQPGGGATYSITAAAQNGTFSNSVTLAASGLPAGATANFAPPSITPGNSSATSTLTIQTAKPVATLMPRGSPWPLAVPALAFIGFFFLPGKRRRRWITLAILLIASLGAFTALSACGGGFGMTAVTPATNYNITITGTSGAVQQTTTVQLTVE